MENDYREKLKRTVVIIPSLNPDEKLNNTVDSMIAAGFSHILLVNDGSAVEHLEPFRIASEHPECTVIGYEENKGKGHALKYAFQYVMDNMQFATGVVTADGDGQHTAEDTRRVAEKLLKFPDSLVLGCRNFKKEGVPTHNKLGNNITRIVFTVFLGIKISDAQTGLRGIGAGNLFRFCEIDGDRYEYESNMLMRANEWKIPFEEVEIQTLYLDDNKSSHFHVIRDSFRIYKPIVIYMASSLGATLIDLTVFTILHLLLDDIFAPAKSLLIASVAARVISAFCNYMFNKKKVFKSSESGAKTLPRFIVVAACVLACSYAMVTFLTVILGLEGFVVTIMKAIVDTLLFLVGYRAQRKWVFAKKD